MVMEFNDGEMQVTWTIEVSEKVEIEEAVFDQFDGARRRVCWSVTRKKSLWRSSILFGKSVLHMCAIRVGVENYVNLWYNIYVTGLPYYFKQPDNKQEVQQHVLRRIVQPGMAGNRRRRRKCLKC